MIVIRRQGPITKEIAECPLEYSPPSPTVMAAYHLPSTPQFIHQTSEEPFFHGLNNGGPPTALRLPSQLDPPQTLSTASHEALLASGNQAYHSLFIQKTILEGKLQQADVEGKCTQISFEPRNPPNDSFRTQKDWTSYKAGMQNEAGFAGDQGPGSCDYIESEDGTPVKWEDAGRSVPETWGKMPHGNKEFFCQTMKEQFPELGFCEDDWKCEHLATHLYPGWHRNHGKASADSKQQSTRKSLH
ncbi:hypothetical protein BJ322DRAFT_1019415 [Thelephora terrestris]|uniref:Uncharacterized protein n=1 Tax=Thelephora terrestris TaxID=56493 RepID=A0A9P6HIQ0_9AGAM|nr:hypothetical protein BJ322DRAFT_1019415 [Thelephora terrestris]